LKSYEIVLDYSHRTMTLISRGHETSAGMCTGTVVPFSVSSTKWRGEPVTEADTELGPQILWWDTGSPATILSKSSVQKARVPVLGKSVDMKRFSLGGFDFGPWRFEVWDISLPGFDGFIGHDFFAKHVVCIDFPGNRVVIVR
jgi:hypothetical protein